MAGIKLVSVNIEFSKHLDRVERFLREQRPDVICMQELMAHDIPALEQALDMRCYFTGTTRRSFEKSPGIQGIGIFSRFPATYASYFYSGDGLPDIMFDDTSAQTKHATESHALSICKLEKDNVVFKICTTHFTWTPDGSTSDEQLQDLEALLRVLAPLDEFVLCGDFNAPRIHEGKPGEIFSKLSEKYKDNIPAEYETSIDINLHRAGKLRPHELADKMVDGLFTTPGYTASEVVLHSGVSDHCAIVAQIAH